MSMSMKRRGTRKVCKERGGRERGAGKDRMRKRETERIE
jgi:hypothetical protein